MASGAKMGTLGKVTIKGPKIRKGRGREGEGKGKGSGRPKSINPEPPGYGFTSLWS